MMAEVRKFLNPAVIVPIFFFLALLLLGLAVFRDYGSFWDEGNERYSGIVNLNAVVRVIAPGISQKIQERKGVVIQPLSGYVDRYYGEILQLPMAGGEVLKGLSQDKRHMWQTRHLMLFLFVYLATIFLFLLIKRAMGHWVYGLIGTSLFWLSPRFFAESFYNIKDVGFLAAFIIGLFFLILILENTSFARAGLSGLMSAFASAVRILGGVFVLFAAGFLISKVIKRQITLKDFFLKAFVLIASFALFLSLVLSGKQEQSPTFLSPGAFLCFSLPLERPRFVFGKNHQCARSSLVLSPNLDFHIDAARNAPFLLVWLAIRRVSIFHTRLAFSSRNQTRRMADLRGASAWITYPRYCRTPYGL